MNPAGRLRFAPAHALPTIASSRPLGLARVLNGQAPEQAARWLPAVFTLCAGAHHLAATLATEAATGLRVHACPTELRALRHQTLAEHLRRIWLDWPAALQAEAAQPHELALLAPLLGTLSAGPAPGTEGPLADAIATRVFGSPSALRHWWAAWTHGDDDALHAWAQGHSAGHGTARSEGHEHPLPARTLAPVWQTVRQLALEALPPLPRHPSGGDWATLWLHLWSEDFVAAPHWHGHPAETGPWTRATHRPPRHALDRLLGRLAEVARLTLTLTADPDSAAPDAMPLDAGAWSPAPGQALGWCQMARGLLVHAAEVEGHGAAARIRRYAVLAPTEWNFHPRGAAAWALSRLDAMDDPTRACALIAAAFDPCVEFEVDGHPQEERAHA